MGFDEFIKLVYFYKFVESNEDYLVKKTVFANYGMKNLEVSNLKLLTFVPTFINFPLIPIIWKWDSVVNYIVDETIWTY